MVYRQDNGLIVVRMDNGEIFPDGLRNIFRDMPYLESAVFLSALGMLNDFELGYFRDGEYLTGKFDEPMELISLSGSIAREADPWFHVHAVLGRQDKTTVGGHLFRGTVWGTLEIFMLASGIKLGRVKKGNLKILEIL